MLLSIYCFLANSHKTETDYLWDNRKEVDGLVSFTNVKIFLVKGIKMKG